VLVRAAQREGELAKGWEDTILQLSVRVAEKIIGEQLKLQPETIVDIVRQVLRATRAGKHMIIQVNEADAPMVRGRVDRLKESLGVSPEIEIVALATIPRGGCVIDSELGIIDARLETQLKCMEEALLGGSSGD
jgi:flagellar biosynthesis/type III secretory pathway protein FliH